MEKSGAYFSGILAGPGPAHIPQQVTTTRQHKWAKHTHFLPHFYHSPVVHTQGRPPPLPTSTRRLQTRTFFFCITKWTKTSCSIAKKYLCNNFDLTSHVPSEYLEYLYSGKTG